MNLSPSLFTSPSNTCICHSDVSSRRHVDKTGEPSAPADEGCRRRRCLGSRRAVRHHLRHGVNVIGQPACSLAPSSSQRRHRRSCRRKVRRLLHLRDGIIGTAGMRLGVICIISGAAGEQHGAISNTVGVISIFGEAAGEQHGAISNTTARLPASNTAPSSTPRRQRHDGRRTTWHHLHLQQGGRRAARRHLQTMQTTSRRPARGLASSRRHPPHHTAGTRPGVILVFRGAAGVQSGVISIFVTTSAGRPACSTTPLHNRDDGNFRSAADVHVDASSSSLRRHHLHHSTMMARGCRCAVRRDLHLHDR